MAITAYRLWFDNSPADEARLALIEEIRVDQAIDMVTEAQITIPLGRDDTGDWPGALDDAIRPLTRVRIEVQVGEGDFVPLIEGRVVAQRFELAGGPNESQAVIVVNDESAMMNRTDRARLFEDMSPEDIAAQVFGEYGIAAETETSGVGAPSLERVVTQRGTDFGLLRRLAREANMVVHVEPGSAPGQSTGHFRRLPLDDDGLPELVLTGLERNVNRLVLELDVLSGVTARANDVDPASLDLLEAEAEATAHALLGETAATEDTGPGIVFATAPGGDRTLLDAAVQASVDRGAFAWSGHGEVSAEIYPGVLRPYRTVAVAGAGTRLSGRYLVSEVSHSLKDMGYTQTFTLRRNATSAAGGGLPGGIV
ncbi:phage late control D family protein [Rhodovulum euryhalinum]|uniref:Late control gene D protein (GPD) n=1 Tax=Rhodovulum euryhalinum TaxID=35805 RepID=A0A4R2KCV5_9RHOB|nr:contractile injection system protein, VgrG/Pvc8 family [Rhodovulum euryhalinum]TCO70112.1 late control gene D protein (GPD) [Rhodovulum euryhalinum]